MASNIFLLEPSGEALEELLLSHGGPEAPLSYPSSSLYASRRTPPSPVPEGSVDDAMSAVVGEGRQDYERAVVALQSLRQYELGWVKASAMGRGVGMEVAIAVRVLGTWNVGLVRVVWMGEEDVGGGGGGEGGGGGGRRFEMVMGTMELHMVSGEERFCVEWNGEEEGEVVLSLASFSRPAGWISSLGWVVGRWYQGAFGSAVVDRVRSLIQDGDTSPAAVPMYDV